MSFQIKQATRQGVNPLIVPYAESGCGKTMSALLIARGIAGPTGKIVLADSESGRGSLYADVIPGGYETFDLCPPFSPARYIEAVDAIEASVAAVGIIDSGSHEWEGIGGVLDLASANEERSGRPGLHNWKTPKLEHAKFVQRLLRSKIPFIVCLRAKQKSRQIKDERGKTQIVKDDAASPIQAEDFIFEATAHLQIMPDHTIVLTKCSHPGLRDCFPKDLKEPLSIKHGEAIAAWAVGGKVSGPQKPTAKIINHVQIDSVEEKLIKQTPVWIVTATTGDEYGTTDAETGYLAGQFQKDGRWCNLEVEPGRQSGSWRLVNLFAEEAL